MRKYFSLFMAVLGFSLYVSLRNQMQLDVTASPHWYSLFTWPEGVTVWALFLTFMAIAEQAVYTRRAAEISRRALVSTFRPQVVIGSIKLSPSTYAAYQEIGDAKWNIELMLVNKGASNAHISSTELNFFIAKTIPWDKPEIPLTQQTWGEFTIPPAARHSLTLEIPYDSGFSIHFGTQVQAMKNNFYSEGQAIWPTCLGIVLYADDNGHQRQTGFLRRWNIGGERFEVSRDPQFEYQD